MKVKYTLEKTESQGIRQMLEDIPTDLCGYVHCPEGMAIATEILVNAVL